MTALYVESLRAADLGSMRRPWARIQAGLEERCRADLHDLWPMRGTLTTRPTAEPYAEMGWADIMFEPEPW